MQKTWPKGADHAIALSREHAPRTGRGLTAVWSSSVHVIHAALRTCRQAKADTCQLLSCGTVFTSKHCRYGHYNAGTAVIAMAAHRTSKQGDDKEVGNAARSRACWRQSAHDGRGRRHAAIVCRRNDVMVRRKKELKDRERREVGVLQRATTSPQPAPEDGPSGSPGVRPTPQHRSQSGSLHHRGPAPGRSRSRSTNPSAAGRGMSRRSARATGRRV